MKKTLYLWHVGQGWIAHEYKQLSELSEMLTERKITIGYSATIGHYAEIGDSATIGDYATIGHSATIGDSATIGHSATIGDYATIGNSATIGNYAEIGDKEKPSTLFITDERHTIGYWGQDILAIGCERHSFQKWEKHFEKIGKSENYTPAQIQRYGKIIALVKAFHELEKSPVEA